MLKRDVLEHLSWPTCACRNLSGQQLYERAVEERPDLLRRFVFATGDPARPETMSFLVRLPNRILQKPLELETVRRVLGQAIANCSSRS